jgi:hypothetical protein
VAQDETIASKLLTCEGNMATIHFYFGQNGVVNNVGGIVEQGLGLFCGPLGYISRINLAPLQEKKKSKT